MMVQPLDRLPDTPSETARHELAHGFAACLACAHHYSGAYGHLTLSLSVTGTDEGEAYESWSDEIRHDIRTHVAALSAVGPIALMSERRMRHTIAKNSYETSPVLSDADLSRLRKGNPQRTDSNSLVLATYYYLHQLGESRLQKLCDVLLSAPKRSLDIPAVSFLPRQQAKAALAAIPALGAAVDGETSLMEVMR